MSNIKWAIWRSSSLRASSGSRLCGSSERLNAIAAGRAWLGRPPALQAVTAIVIARVRESVFKSNVRKVRAPTIAFILLAACAAVQIAYYLPRLPAVIVSHFNAAGIADGWEAKPFFLEFYVIILVMLGLIFLLVPRLMYVIPVEMINLPNKAYWLAPERRASSLAFFVDHFEIFGAATLVLLVCFMQLTMVANLSAPVVFPTLTALVLLAAYFAFAIVWLVIAFRRFPKV
jgi:uncharacterized membrane protein